MVTRSVIAIVLLQGCLMNAGLIPSSSSLRAFHLLWMENSYDASIYKEYFRSPKCESKPDGIYGNPTGCSTNYVVCSEGNTLASLFCRSGEIFDDFLASCIAPDASLNCRNSVDATTAPPPPPVTIPPFTCEDGRPDGSYPISECSPNYYSCINGEMRLYKCLAAGFVFDPETLVCKDSTTVAGCSAATTTTTTASTTTASTTITSTTTTTTELVTEATTQENQCKALH